MYPKGNEGVKRNCILKEPSKNSVSDYDKQQENYIFNNKLIEAEQIIISGITGSGKTTGLFELAEEYHDAGATIIVLTEKVNSECDFAFTDFLPSFKSEGNFYEIHKEFLKKQYEEATSHPTKIYHPFTFEIPKKELKNMPDSINLFTIPVKGLSINALTSFFSGKFDKKAVKIIEQTLMKIKSDETIFDLMWQIYNKILDSKDKDILIADEESGFIPTGTTSTVGTKNEIVEALSYFIKNPTIDVVSERNINFDKMILDNKTYHLLTTKWISNKTIKYFFYIYFIDKIMETLGKMKKAPPVVLVFEELRVLLPSKDKDSSVFQNVLSSTLKTLLSTARKIGATQVTTLGNTQVMFDTDEDYINSCSQKFIGKCAESDMKRLWKDYQVQSDVIKKIRSLNIGEFMWWRDEFPILISGMPRHAMPTAGFDYFNVFESVYPERMKDNSDLFEQMKVLHKEWLKKSEIMKDELEAKLKKEKEAKEKAKEDKEEVEKIKKEAKKEKNEENEMELAEKCYALKQQGKSYREIASDVFGKDNKEKMKNKVDRLIKKYEQSFGVIEQEPKI